MEELTLRLLTVWNRASGESAPQRRTVKEVLGTCCTGCKVNAPKLVGDGWKTLEAKPEQVVVAAHHDDLMPALARKIVSGEEDDAESVAEEYLVDDGWKVVEPALSVPEKEQALFLGFVLFALTFYDSASVNRP